MSTVEFVIKNQHCGKYIHPVQPQHHDRGELYLWDGFYDKTIYVFEQADGEWGYIRQKDSDQVWQPRGMEINAMTNTEVLRIHSGRERYSLFAIDQLNGHIIHRDGLYVHYAAGTNPYPPNGDRITIHRDINEGMKWEFLNPSDSSKEVQVYGHANILGDWKMVYAVKNPKAEQIRTYTYKVGKSHTESSTSSFEFGWEASISAGFSFYQMSTSVSLTTAIENASSDTWSEETEKLIQ
ncbi:unnamed protein product [Meganyctiphanes norvegica]|uniref:Uncharacterized protein n=2 Tax=Meganyctiphanes norvegica TaxID=48144 RepID=A0AAV2RTA3_MEGNR